MKVAVIVGSIRKESFNKKLAQFLQQRYADRLALELLEIRNLPHYDQDIENDAPPAVTEFKKQVAEADAVLWITPEYNYAIPGVLKNALDWLSRVDKVMIGKPSWIMGASMGQLGTVRAQNHLRDILFSPGITSPLIPNNETYVGAAHEKFDAEGKLVHEPTIAHMDKVVDNFINWMNSRK
ncbi:NADPH-dependent FMN reductase [Paenibacillus sp. NEAU-GSW1]|uniref:NADPH-dependent FMN reductase n=1 Tax=Paenibacillus sp. NEAU-GSW1 TaxID=2682486 RepID=UPI0012E14639|nr:NADPH-dependent FMN reductase [Paenibacillus sp. NEAU-GSW1]MUT67191.1 NADPH-dependent FMN reductase [Paenibacillus sp. NEAU-GSW1]